MKILTSTYGAICLVCLLSFSNSAYATPPNIVFVMVDDLGIAELGVTGQLARAQAGLKSIDTPNIDALANNGLMMNNFYATPICGSTRSAVLTGFHNGHSSVDRNGGNQGGNAMRAVDITFAETLKTVGYKTGQFGKWGQGGYEASSNIDNINQASITHPDAIPTAQGFDEFYGYLNQVHAHDYYVNFLWEQDGVGGLQVSPTSNSDYSHDLISQRAVDFVANHADPTGTNPFLLYAPFTLPHGDFNPPEDSIWQDYKDRLYTDEEADYAAMVTRLDRSVGDIVNKLKDPDGDGNQSDSVYDNTLIIFTSDNGGWTGKNGSFGGGGNLRNGKGTVHEGGIRSPFIASWNGTIAPGQVDNSTIASLEDMHATFADLAGAEAPVGLDSASIAGLLTENAIEDRHFLIFEARNNNDWAIRKDNWKLSKSGNNVLALYDLSNDGSETNNLLNNPTPAQQDIANLLQAIALAEGVESDAGNGVTQTTHIVQYKHWAPQGGSNDWAANSNWGGGSEFNTRGMAANNFNTSPANNWIAKVENTSPAPVETVVANDSTVLGMEVMGTAETMKVRVTNGARLTARNGVRIHDGGRIELEGGVLSSIRTIDIRAGGELVGTGEIGTEHDLGVVVKNAGRLEISALASSVPGPPIELVSNGSFENGLGTGTYTFQELDDWQTDGSSTVNAAIDNSAQAGAYRGLVAARPSDSNNQLQDTGHVITLGEEYSLNFFHRGFLDWDNGNDQIVAEVFYIDDFSVRQSLGTLTVDPQVGLWNQANASFPAVVDSNAIGRNLWINFSPMSNNGTATNEFASLDSVSLTIPGPPIQPANLLAIDGDFQQTPSGELAIELFGANGVAGVDFDQLNVAGDVVLDGGLQISFDNLVYTPNVGDEFQILTSSGIILGEFASRDLPQLSNNLHWNIDYGSQAVTVSVINSADFNADGAVDALDLTIWENGYGATSAGQHEGDTNGDRQVDGADFLNWQRQLTGSGGTVTAAVPEPSSLVVLLSGILVSYRIRSK